MMKMIVAILRDEDTECVTQSLVEGGLQVTMIASSGGFLRQGRSTLLIGVEEDRVDQAIEHINENCTPSIEPMLRKATVFVLNVEHFEQL